jgi:dihydrofolate reductase
MRKIILLMHASLDGLVGGPHGEMDWILHDEEMFQYVTKHFEGLGAALYGRVTYQMMESYWPTVPKNPESTKQELHHAEWVEKISKLVISKSLDKVTWNNTRLIKDNLAEEIIALKKQSGGDVMIFGSPRLSHSLMSLGLIDEYLLQINPILLGEGIPLFQDLKGRAKLRLISHQTFKNGVIGLHYQKV